MVESLEPTTLVIFGVSGDLSQRYLLPALAEICQNLDLKTHLKILGISRRPISVKQVLGDKTASLAGQFEIFQMDYGLSSEYHRFKKCLDKHGGQQVIFYFAVPPDAVLSIVDMLGTSKMNTSKYKLLMEKPFGTDLDSAKKLISQTDRCFKENQVYRIDHYLAKEMAQNIAVFLGSNVLFKDVWNNQFIERIEIVAEESIGIKGREHFYEQTGALRDIIQSHLLQLAALTLMEPCPDVFDFSQVQSRRLAALQNLVADPTSVIKAQYTGYRQEVDNLDSKVETFVSLNLESKNPKWVGVPIQLTAGKNLKEKLTEIRVYFRKSQAAQANLLRLRVQPQEGIELDLWVKKPGYDQNLQMLPLGFSYQQHFERLPDAYEQVIVDAIRSRSNLFAGSQEVITSWQILQPLLSKWDSYELNEYKPGTSAAELLN
jgi:glucose-6-phosphate 1-dehydrogenase